MPTNPIPPGSCNLPINMATEERAVLGKLAFQAGKSTGAYVRDLIVNALRKENPDAASHIETIRRVRKVGWVEQVLVWAGVLAPVTLELGRRGILFRKPKQA